MATSGKMLSDRYRLIEEIGEGGMAKVYLAEDLRLKRKVAIKTIKDSVSAKKALKRRFRHEAKICSKVSHPNVISIFDYGTLDNGELFYAMEYLPYPDLSEAVTDGQLFKAERLLPIMRQLAAALEACHELGVIHRDIKTANIIMKEDGQVVLSDFGLVRLQDTTRMTATGEFVGTPLYLPPEALLTQKVDERCDIYQLGLVFYNLHTGKNILGDCSLNISMLLEQIMSPDFDPPKLMSPLVSDVLRPIIARCIERDPEDRFANIGELIEALDGVDDGTKASAPVVEELPLAPQAKDKKPVARNHSLAFWVLTLFAFFVLAIVWGAGPKEGTSWQTRDFKAMQGTQEKNTIVVTWKSDSAYRSQLYIESDSHKEVSKASEVATQSHRVVLDTLQMKEKYRISVIYPSGDKSLGINVSTDGFVDFKSRQKSFTKKLASFVKNPSRLSGGDLSRSARGLKEIFLLDSVIGKVPLCSSFLLSKDLKFKDRFEKAHFCYITLLRIFLQTSKVAKSQLLSRSTSFANVSYAFLTTFKKQEETQRDTLSEDKDFKLASFGIAGRASYARLLKAMTIEFKDAQKLPLALLALQTYVTCEKYESGSALIELAQFRKAMAYAKPKGREREFLSTLAFLIEIIANSRLEKVEKCSALSDEFLAATKSFAPGWSSEGYSEVSKMVYRGQKRAFDLIQSKSFLTDAELAQKAQSILRAYKEMPFHRTMGKHLATYTR